MNKGKGVAYIKTKSSSRVEISLPSLLYHYPILLGHFHSVKSRPSCSVWSTSGSHPIGHRRTVRSALFESDGSSILLLTCEFLRCSTPSLHTRSFSLSLFFWRHFASACCPFLFIRTGPIPLISSHSRFVSRSIWSHSSALLHPTRLSIRFSTAVSILTIALYNLFHRHICRVSFSI